MVNVEVLKKVYLGSTAYVPGETVYVNEGVAKTWYKTGAATPQAKPKVERAVLHPVTTTSNDALAKARAEAKVEVKK